MSKYSDANLVKVMFPDWEAVYENGELSAEGHSIAPSEWFKLGQNWPSVTPEEIEIFEITDEEFIELGDVPYFLDDYPEGILE
jgi:hypothetical protein